MLDLLAIKAKLAAPDGWGCEKECGLSEVEALVCAVESLYSALQAVIAAVPSQWAWCSSITVSPPCGKCLGCMAWQQAQKALGIGLED